MLTVFSAAFGRWMTVLIVLPIILLPTLGCGSSDKKNARALMTVDEALEKGLINQMEALRQREISGLVPAIKSGARYRAAELIWEGNVDLDASGGGQGTALHVATRRGDVDLVELLVSAGANINSTRAFLGPTPLHVAGEYGQLEVLKTLVSLGADVNSLSSGGGSTPLDSARWESLIARVSRDTRSEMVKFLLSKGAKTAQELKGGKEK